MGLTNTFVGCLAPDSLYHTLIIPLLTLLLLVVVRVVVVFGVVPLIIAERRKLELELI